MSIATLEGSEIALNFKANKEINIQHKLVNDIAKREGFINFDIEIRAINNKGGNYLGILYAALVRGEKDEKIQDLHLFLKVAETNPGIRDMISLHEIYSNEIFSYKIISKLYNEIQINESIPDQKRLAFPKFYGSIEEDCREAIVLENLTTQNYTVQDRFQCITLEYAKKAIEHLAKFHALSYIAERRDPEYFDEVIRVRKGNIYLDNDSPERLKKFSDFFKENGVKNVRNERYRERINEFCNDMYNDIGKYVKTNKYPALCHGDYRGNNLLVKYKNDTIQSVLAVDYQFIHFGSPLNDLFYFLYVATDRQFRDNHLQYLIKFYYRCLSDFVGLFSYDINDIYPRCDFDEDAKSHRIFGLVVAINTLQFILATEEDAPDLSECSEDTLKDLSNSKNEFYLVRYNEIVDEFVDLGI